MYLLASKVCWKQYVRQTVDRFRLRWNNYKENNCKTVKDLEHKQACLFNHFKTEGHRGFFNDVVITFVDKADGSDPTRRD